MSGLVRTKARQHLVDHITAALAPIPVTLTLPGPDFEDEHVYCANTNSVDDYPVLGPGAKLDDQFTIDLYVVSSTPGRTAAEAEEATESIVNGVLRVVAANVQMASASSALTSTVLDVLVSRIDGPEAVARGDGEGYEGWARVQVTIHSRVDL